MSDEPFLSRWSRRKQEAKAPVAQPDPEPPPQPEPPAAEEPPPDLPAIDSLGPDSDFSAFLKPNVPPALRQQALTKLWASNPSLMAPEVMDLHMGDYTAPALGEVVKTAWRLGKGVLDAVELKAEEDAAIDQAEQPPDKA